MNWLALDIGGTNLKAADGCGWAASVPFALSQHSAGLVDELAALVSTAPSWNLLAITMTGELSDAFRTKAEGVREILSAVEQVASNGQVRVYLVDGRLVSLDEAREMPWLAAASNWHALARFATRFVRGQFGLLLDIGSTTSDVIPLVDGRPATRGTTDTERLQANELVYTGVRHTPICAVTRILPFGGQECAVAAEVFATMADIYVLLGDLAEQHDPVWTPDGRPLTADFAHERLARMVCADRDSFGAADARRAAEYVRDVQLLQIQDAARSVVLRHPTPPDCIVISGAGEFLARRVASAIAPRCLIISLTEELGHACSESAPAHALAVMAREMATP